MADADECQVLLASSEEPNDVADLKSKSILGAAAPDGDLDVAGAADERQQGRTARVAVAQTLDPMSSHLDRDRPCRQVALTNIRDHIAETIDVDDATDQRAIDLAPWPKRRERDDCRDDRCRRPSPDHS